MTTAEIIESVILKLDIFKYIAYYLNILRYSAIFCFIGYFFLPSSGSYGDKYSNWRYIMSVLVISYFNIAVLPELLKLMLVDQIYFLINWMPIVHGVECLAVFLVFLILSFQPQAIPENKKLIDKLTTIQDAINNQEAQLYELKTEVFKISNSTEGIKEKEADFIQESESDFDDTYDLEKRIQVVIEK